MNPPGKIKIVTATLECCMCPTIVIGTTDDGWAVYCRYRWGMLSIRLDPRNPPPRSGAAGQWIMVKQLDPAGLNGCLDYEEIRELTADIIEWPAELTPLTYEGTDATTFPDNAG
jgi:hypothetical protein